MFCTRVTWLCLVCLRYVYLYEVPLSMSLLGFGMGTVLVNFHMCGIMLVLRAAFIMIVRKSKRAYVF